MFFSKDKIDLGAAKSRAVVDAVRFVEILLGEPVELSFLKMTKKGVAYSNGWQPEVVCVDFFIEVGGSNQVYEIKLTLVRDESGYWSSSEGDLFVSGKRYLLKGYRHFFATSLKLKADIVSVYECDSVDIAWWGTSWCNRISDDVNADEALQLLRQSE